MTTLENLFVRRKIENFLRKSEKLKPWKLVLKKSTKTIFLPSVDIFCAFWEFFFCCLDMKICFFCGKKYLNNNSRVHKKRFIIQSTYRIITEIFLEKKLRGSFFKSKTSANLEAFGWKCFYLRFLGFLGANSFRRFLHDHRQIQSLKSNETKVSFNGLNRQSTPEFAMYWGHLQIKIFKFNISCEQWINPKWLYFNL